MLRFAILTVFLSVVNSQTLPATYPAMDTIPPILPDVVATVNWQNASPAQVITACANTNSWALTYDDGPSASTPALLDFLKSKGNQKATFFVVGSRIRTNPAVLQRAYAEGHQIGMKGWSHMNLSDPSSSMDALIMEIKWNIKIINDTIGVVPRYFRPPYGLVTNDALKVLSAFGLVVVKWNQASNDFSTYQDPVLSAAAVQAVNGWLPSLKNGSIISYEIDLFPGEVNMALQIGQVAIDSGAAVSPVATCLNDAKWYSQITVLPAAPPAYTAQSSSAMIAIQIGAVFGVAAAFWIQ